VVIVLDGGVIQEVLTSEDVEVGVIDYDTQDLDTADLTDIPQGDGTTEVAYVSLNVPSVMPERTTELITVIKKDVNG
jgi:hypothetical protein